MKSILRQLKFLAKVAIGKELLEKPDLVRETERLGSDYGGWDVVTKDLTSGSVVYSFGVGEDISFDTELIEKHDLVVHAFDPTPRSIDYVSAQGPSEKFIMHCYGLAAFDGEVSFNPPENPDHVSHTILDRPSTSQDAIAVPVRKLATIMSELGHNVIDILKMDIEGAEYEVIDDIVASDIRPRQILVEFHHRFPGIGIEMTRQAIESLRRTGYRLVSISDSREEYCFILSAS